MNEYGHIQYSLVRNHFLIMAYGVKDGQKSLQIQVERDGDVVGKINEVSLRYRSLVALRSFFSEDDPGILLILKQLGEQLYSLFFSGLEQFLNQYSTIMVEQEKYLLPLELAYNGKQFIGLSHALGNWLSQLNAPKAEVFHVDDLKEERFKSLFLGQEKNWLLDFVQNNTRQTTKIITNAKSEKLIEELTKEHYDFIHLSGHGRFDTLNPQNSFLALDQNDMKNFVTLQQFRNKRLQADLFVLNACQSGKVTEDYQGFTGFAQSFLEFGVKSFISTFWTIQDQSASRFSSYLYASLLQGDAVGEALRKARMRCWIDNRDMLTGLSYILFGNPLIQVFDTDIKVTEVTPIQKLNKQGIEHRKLNTLYQQLLTGFNQRDLKNLCFRLSVDFEGLPSQTRSDLARELVAYCERRGILNQLIYTCQQERPSISWPNVTNLLDHVEGEPNDV